MYVVAQHQIKDPATALAQGEKLIAGDAAPSGTRALQFYPSQDRAAVTCLWEATSVHAVQEYVDGVLGDASINNCYEVAAEVEQNRDAQLRSLLVNEFAITLAGTIPNSLTSSEAA